ncbi:hypothetical protein [Xenorhabdus cabanillasii]|uniref:hypothetical protein n=2 Tax=Xenorhabdus cabanillasii TaxID=351673 RepID=UPI000C03D227|nr:hypothetical protein [Xenorhabdus cabanillasii]
MLGRPIDFRTLPEAEPANGQYAYWWNAPRFQGQAILSDINSLPRVLRYPCRNVTKRFWKNRAF